MPKRKISLNQMETTVKESPTTTTTSTFEVIFINPSHSTPKLMKTESTEIIVTEEDEDDELLNTVSSESAILKNENNEEEEPPATHQNSEIEIREDVYIISEITPDKFVISQHNEEGTNNETIPTTEDHECIVQSGSDVVQLVDFGACCANCSIPFDDGECTKISELIISENEMIEGVEVVENNLEYGIVVSVSDALSFIFEIKLNEEDHGERPLVDSGIGLCNKCGNILAQMYKLHREFYEAAVGNSYLDLLFAKVFSRDSTISSQISKGVVTDTVPNQSGENNTTEEQLTNVGIGQNNSSIPLEKGEVRSSNKDISQNNHTVNIATQIPPTQLLANNGNQILKNETNIISPESVGVTPAGLGYDLNSIKYTGPCTSIPISSTTSGKSFQSQTTNNFVDSSQINGNAVQPNFLVICPVVIAANAGTNTLATMKTEKIKMEEDLYFNESTDSIITKTYRRNRPKFDSTCPECGKTFRSYLKNALENHINIVHRNESPHTCTICGRPCSTHKNMETHMRTHLGKNEKDESIVVKTVPNQFLCSECGTTLRSASSLRLHLSKHKNPKPCQCDKCDRRFGDKVSLRRHQVIHEVDGIFPFQCEGCGQGFKAASLLKEHNMFCVSKSSERPHKCNLCGKRFKLKQHLELHLFEMHKFSKEGAREVVYPGLPKKKRTK